MDQISLHNRTPQILAIRSVGRLSTIHSTPAPLSRRRRLLVSLCHASQNSAAAPAVMPWPCKGEEECISGLVCCCCQKIWEYPANPEESVPSKQAMNMCLYPVCGQRLCVLHFYCCPWPSEEVEEAEGDLVCSLSSTLQSLLQVVLVHQNT